METVFDHEKLDVYRVSLEFIAWAADLLRELREVNDTAAIRDHLDRASLSILLNIAEGNGKRQRQIRAKFFDDARGSGTECAACLDAAVARKACSKDRIVEGKARLVRIVSMLCKLVEKFSDGYAVHENDLEYDANGKSTTRTKDEEEDDKSI
jgi:four helix bundle protein